MNTEQSNVIQMPIKESNALNRGNIARGIIQRLMSDNHHTMMHLANQSGLSLMLIAGFINGRIRNLSHHNLERIARCYGLSGEDLKAS